MSNLAVFASGNGSNYEAIATAIKNKQIDGEIKLVVVDKLDAFVIKRAKANNHEVFVFNPKDYDSKDAYEKIIVEKLNEKNIDLVILAGYMRILSTTLLNAYENKIINIHPSLLPAFIGKDAIGQAIVYGTKVMGVTVHYVNSEMDGGRIIAQKSFDVIDEMSKDDIENCIHKIEHQMYPDVINKLIKGEIK